MDTGAVPRGVVGAVALVGFAGLFASCGDPEVGPVAGAELTTVAADFVDFGMRTVFTTDGVRNAEVRADSAYIYSDSSVAQLFGMQMTVYTEDGREQAFVMADSARMLERTQQMEAWGNVLVTLAAQGDRIETQSLNYDPLRGGAGEIWSDLPVRITSNGSVTTGSSFTSDLRLENYRLLDPRGAIPQRPAPTDPNSPSPAGGVVPGQPPPDGAAGLPPPGAAP